MIAVIPVRDGVPAGGAAEAVAEAGGRAIALEVARFTPGALAAALAAAPVLGDERGVVLPGSPDGRDIAPRLAAELGRPLFAGAVAVTDARIDLARHGGRAIERISVTGPFVATLQPGVRGADGVSLPEPALELEVDRDDRADAETIDVLAPDASTIDLAEAERIVAAGGGLDGPERLVQLAGVARALNASLGATRVVTDKGWLPYDRQIGTTGVAVDPRLYVALGISGAVQHVNGIGMPDHLVAVNTDPHCPMMAMAHLAIVCDANPLLDELELRLGATGG